MAWGWRKRKPENLASAAADAVNAGEFLPNITTFRQSLPSAIVSVIDLIASRVAQTPFVGHEAVRRPSRNWSASEWWKAATARLLRTGDLLIVRQDGGLVVCENTLTLLTNGSYQITALGTQTIIATELENIAHVRYGSANADTLTFVGSPCDAAIQQFSKLAEELIKAETEIMQNANKVSGSIQQTKAWSPDELFENLEKYRSKMKLMGRGSVGGLLDGLEFKPGTRFPSNDHLAEIYNEFIRAVARLYHVPPELLGVGRNERSAEQIDALFMRYAVAPVRDSILAELTKVFNIPITIEASLAGLTTDKASAAMRMAQTGVATGNEIRTLLGLPSSNEFNRIPAPAGAPTRENDNG